MVILIYCPGSTTKQQDHFDQRQKKEKKVGGGEYVIVNMIVCHVSL